MAFDFKTLASLPPDERVAALQKLEDELQALIKKRNDEIKQSQKEIAEAEALLNRAKDEMVVLEKIAKPENKGVRIDDLFFKKADKKKDKPLEESVADEPIALRKQQEQAYLAQPRLGDVIKAFYEDTQRPGLPDEQASAYVSGNQPVQDTRAAYHRPKDEKMKLVGQGAYNT